MVSPPFPTGSLGDVGISKNTPEIRIYELSLDDIDIPANMRVPDEATVNSIAESISELGLQAQGLITIRWNETGAQRRATLVAGQHRLAAFRKLGWSTVVAAVFNGNEIEAEAWRLAENLYRKDLSSLERAEQIARWIEIKAEKRAQNAQVFRGRGNKGGLSEAAATLGVDRRAVATVDQGGRPLTTSQRGCCRTQP